MNETKVKDYKGIKPTGDKILVANVLPETKTKSGLILVPDSTDKNQRNYVGDVLAISPDAEGNGIFVGDRVIYTGGLQYDLSLEYSPQGIPTHSLVSWFDVVAVVEDKSVDVKASL